VQQQSSAGVPSSFPACALPLMQLKLLQTPPVHVPFFIFFTMKKKILPPEPSFSSHMQTRTHATCTYVSSIPEKKYAPYFFLKLLLLLIL
jgi:hypothetical protein